jgi:hypothetical protein
MNDDATQHTAVKTMMTQPRTVFLAGGDIISVALVTQPAPGSGIAAARLSERKPVTLAAREMRTPYQTTGHLLCYYSVAVALGQYTRRAKRAHSCCFARVCEQRASHLVDSAVYILNHPGQALPHYQAPKSRVRR